MGKTLMFLNPRKKRKGRRSTRRRHAKRNRMHLNPRKGRRSGRRRSGRRSSGRSGSVMSSVKHAFSKDIVMTGLGLFGTGVVYSVVMAKFGPRKTGQKDSAGNDIYASSLPLATSSIGPLLYGIGIPVAVAMLTRKFSPSISNGAYLYGISSLINQYIGPTVRQSVNQIAGTSGYVRAGLPTIGVGRLGNGTSRPAVAGAGNFPGYPNIFPTSSFSRK